VYKATETGYIMNIPNKPTTSNIMTNTKTLETLRAEVAALKAAKIAELQAQAEERKQNEEFAKLERQLEDLKNDKMPEASAPNASYSECETERLALESARVRIWAYALGAYLTGPIWTGYIATRTKEWSQFWIGLGLGVVSLPFAFMDMGIISSIPAAAACTAVQMSKTKKAQKKLNIQFAEQADAKMANFRSF
jgi:hypothetical protein